MSTGPINPLSSSYLQSISGSALQDGGLTSKNSRSLSAASSLPQSDNSRLSPFARMLSTLQQLQQTDPAKYTAVTQQIATNLQSAAQTALSDGNPTAANQLNQLAADFTSASSSGQLPNIQDLAQGVKAAHHHHHHLRPAAANPDAQGLNPFLSALQSNGVQNDATNPMSIILNTLSNAGLSGSND